MRIIILAIAVLFCFGCSNIKDITEYIENKQHQDITQSMISDDAQKFAELNFCWGGFNGSNAVWNTATEISNLRIDSKLSYQWLKGDCEQLGASDRADASQTLACLFCLIDGKWLGGKFDWISTSRVTRDFRNIETSYHGWDASAISKASAYRFVIISKNGQSRTNVIEVKR